jgi:acyl-CoA synthetase (AMP-forming)/AMP-acid ligase II
MPSQLPVLAAIAARTEHITVGTGVLLAPMFDPLHLAEDAATVDVLSNGRLTLALGIGWRAKKFVALGGAHRHQGRRPEATRDAFREGWFRTGDTAVVEEGRYRILGRSSVDILKTGGFKVSALEIEEELRTHPAVAECAVVGIPDAEWGDKVSVAIELRPGAALSLEELQRWARERLAPYKVPRLLCTVSALPRNAMGKVVKPEVVKLF